MAISDTHDADRPSPMAPTRLRAVRSSQLAALLFTAALVTVSTVVVAIITPAVPADAAGVFYLLAVLGASSLYGLGWGLATSLASALAFNFFFLPPAHTLVINASSDWLALAAFVATAVVTSNLAARERRGRDETARRATEAQLGEAFATLIAQTPHLDSVLPELGSQAARALGAADGVIDRGPPSGNPRPGILTLELGDRRLGELRLIGCPPELDHTPAAHRVARNLAGLIALGEERERRLHQQVQAEALARSNELKTALLRAVSHDLRSPLMAIATAAGGLRYAQLDEDERELLQTISDEGDRMRRMIDNLLDLSRLQAGAITPAADWLDPRELVEAALDEAATDEDQPRVRLSLGHELPLVRGDGSQLQRVIVNLVENALKFSPQASPVEMSVTLTGGGVEVAVEDHGPGIAADDAEHIFEPFYRSRHAAGVHGSGLGLAIARGLAQANGCRLTVGAGRGGGSRFALVMPAPAGEQRP